MRAWTSKTKGLGWPGYNSGVPAMVVILFCTACGVVLFRVVPSLCRPRSPQEVAGGHLPWCGVVWRGLFCCVEVISHSTNRLVIL
jgi:hypothetical protein